MTDDSRQAVVRRFFEAGWNCGSATAISDMVHEDYTSNDGPFFRNGLRRLSGADAVDGHIRQYHDVYNDLRFKIEKMVLDGDTVVTVWSPTGTTRNRTFTTRSGEERPFELKCQGVSLTDVVGGKVTRHDMFWPVRPLFP
jgi:SnoaL-like domain